MKKLTARQHEVLAFLAETGGTCESGYDGSVLRALAAKGLVTKHFNSAPGYIYYTWTLNEAGKAAQEVK